MTKPTRRQAFLLAAAAAPAMPQPPAHPTPEHELDAARKAVARSAEQLSKVELKPGAEPAFIFRAY